MIAREMMHKYVDFSKTKNKRLVVNKYQKRALLKAEKELEDEVNKQIGIIFHAAAIALFRYHSWNNEQINDLIARVTQELWNECAESTDLSMIQMLYEETGIELMAEDKVTHWYDVIYLNSAKDNGEDLTIYQWIKMRQSQKGWVAAQIMACMLMALHRKEGWKVEGLGKLFNEVEDVKYEFNLDEKELQQACDEETDFSIVDSPIGQKYEG